MKKRCIAAVLLAFLCFAMGGQDPGLVSGPEAAKKLGAKLEWDPLSELGAFSKGADRVVFKEGDPWIYLDGRMRAKAGAAVRIDGALAFPKSFVEASASFLDRAGARPSRQYSIAAVLVDPGHGGKDSGAEATHQIGSKKLSIAEKDVTLRVSKMLYSLLVKRYAGMKVLLTREGDTYPTLDERVDKANGISLSENEAIIYVSIHANASFNKKARGFEVWYLSPDFRRKILSDPGDKDPEILPILNTMLEEEFTTESIIIAKNIMDGLSSLVGKESPNRGIKAEEWFVVRNAKMPSVLIELGFVTNPEEALLLSDDDYLMKLAEGIYNGIVDFIGYFESSKGFTQ
jgi:N-acetylmuramoyl-L-alanine amidase